MMTDQHTAHEPGTDAQAAATDVPRIYVACLAAYNAGRLHGRWIDATDPGDVWEEVRAMLAESPVPDAEEWAIHDYEGFEGCSISEWTSFESVCALAEFIQERGELGAKVFTHFGDNLEEARAVFDDYAGTFRSAADFVEELHDDTGPEIPEPLRFYIDWAAFARDLEINGEILVFETGFEDVHVFWGR